MYLHLDQALHVNLNTELRQAWLGTDPPIQVGKLKL